MDFTSNAVQLRQMVPMLCFLDTFWTMKCISAGGTFSEVISFSSLLFSRYYYCYCYSYSPKLCLSVSLSVCCARKAKFIREPTYSRDIVTFSLLFACFLFLQFWRQKRQLFVKKSQSTHVFCKKEILLLLLTQSGDDERDDDDDEQ